MTLELCNRIIIFKAAAMLHDTDAKFAVIDFALEAKKKTKYCGTLKKKYCGTDIRYQVPALPVTVLKITAAQHRNIQD